MSRARSPNRDKAYEIYKEHDGKIKTSEIAAKLNEKVSNINSWRSQDSWKDRLKGKVGAPIGNKNALGNNGGAPARNKNRYKHGFYSKYLPKQTYDIFEQIDEIDPVEILWQNIKIKYAAILRAQKIMNVKSQNDLTKILKREKRTSGLNSDGWEEEYELQFAWDKQATFLRAQSDAMRTLTKMIKDYEELVNNNPLVSEEQKLRIEKLRLEIKNSSNGSGENSKEGIYEFIKATTIPENEVKALFEDGENVEEKETE